MKRREFLKKISLSIGAVPLATVGTVFADNIELDENKAGLPLHLIVDRRYVRSADQIKTEWLKAGKLSWLDTGLSGSFIQQLKASWVEGAEITAGVTLQAEFFVLKTLAREQGYKVQSQSIDDGIISWTLVADHNPITA